MCNNIRVPLLGEGATIYSLCWTTDIDYFGHMNNGKYFKEMDFGRFDFYFRSGLTELIQVRMILMTMVMMTNDDDDSNDDDDAGQTELVRGAARSISQVQETTQLSCTF